MSYTLSLGLPLPLLRNFCYNPFGMEINLRLNIPGGKRYKKVSYPARYGRLAEIMTPGHCFQFNLNGEIKYLQGTGRDWPHPSEWLKRTSGNHWVYYDSGGYNRFYDYLGEYYLPCFTYGSNPLWEANPFGEASVQEALAAFRRLPEALKHSMKKKNWSAEERAFLLKTIAMDTRRLAERAGQLISLLHGRVTVLPPDTRHVDYDCIPLNMADGCLYHCTFCRIKSSQDFQPRSRPDILNQLNRIKDLYGPDLRNYNSLFFRTTRRLELRLRGNCFRCPSGLQPAGIRAVLSRGELSSLGSVDSFLKAEESLFEALNRLPFRTYLKLGLESADQESLNLRESRSGRKRSRRPSSVCRS